MPNYFSMSIFLKCLSHSLSSLKYISIKSWVLFFEHFCYKILDMPNFSTSSFNTSLPETYFIQILPEVLLNFFITIKILSNKVIISFWKTNPGFNFIWVFLQCAFFGFSMRNSIASKSTTLFYNLLGNIPTNWSKVLSSLVATSLLL